MPAPLRCVPRSGATLVRLCAGAVVLGLAACSSAPATPSGAVESTPSPWTSPGGWPGAWPAAASASSYAAAIADGILRFLGS